MYLCVYFVLIFVFVLRDRKGHLGSYFLFREEKRREEKRRGTHAEARFTRAGESASCPCFFEAVSGKDLRSRKHVCISPSSLWFLRVGDIKGGLVASPGTENGEQRIRALPHIPTDAFWAFAEGKGGFLVFGFWFLVFCCFFFLCC